MKEDLQKNISALFESCYSVTPQSIDELPSSGSNRKYFRLASKDHKAIAAYNADKKENLAFIVFSQHFKNHHLPVPEILAADLDHNSYLLEDLGDETLFSYLESQRQEGFSDEMIALYKNVLDDLLCFQIDASRDLDYSICYPRAAFDKQSMMWDLNYFKYYFLKLAQINFDEQKLEDDFNVFAHYLLQADCSYFLYRDFQSRNIMLNNDKLYYIDYQGGRKGPLHYDVASLLYDAKAAIPQKVREILLDYYIEKLGQKIEINENEFRKHFYGFVLIRIMQAMGAYGFRGYYEKKSHFLKSIPYAVSNLKWIRENIQLPLKTDTLTEVFNQIITNKNLKKYSYEKSEKLTVSINSFSYKKGYPADLSGNGGGFVFDCRALPNPGRFIEYKNLTGKDAPVIEFLEKENETERFFVSTRDLVKQSVENYLERGFSSLNVNFGCTGGQHRSVYFAERMVKYLKETFAVDVVLNHNEQKSGQ